jgi:MFS family permease
VQEKDERAHPPPAAKRVSWRDVRRLDQRFYIVTAIASVLTLARFSEAFLVLRGQDVGMGNTGAPWVMVAMSLVYAAFAFPAGRLADRGHATSLLSAGLAALVASDVVLGLAQGAAGAIAGASLWGLHMALTQGLLAALVAATAPPDLRGSAFGVYNLASGVALLIASALAGYLWESVGPAATFFTGAAITVVAWIGLSAYASRVPRLDS